MPGQFVELSHTIHHGLETYRCLPRPIVCDYLSREASRRSYADGTEFHIGKIEMVGNTGTYLDAPFHRFADGADLAAIPLDRVADLPGVVIAPPPDRRAIDVDAVRDLEVAGRAVLVRTGWSRHFATERYFEGHPFLTEAAARHLADAGAALVGIDSFNIDDTADGRRPVHTVLLGRGVPIVEHLVGLERLPAEGFAFFAPPVKIAGFGSFPVRAFAVVGAAVSR